MKKHIILKVLTLKNFKGIKNIQINFCSTTDIYGDNGTGKTTIFDAFTWLLFDKDSNDRKNFDIKTLDSSNKAIQGLEHEVTGILLVDGVELKLSKIHKEKWIKKKGEADKTFSGNETLYYVDEVPVKQSEYQEKINSLINENIFKLITNTLYFSENMKWQERRAVIIEIIGDIASDRIISHKSSLKGLEKLLFNKDIETLRKSLAARKKKLNEDIKSIPYRIDELNNSLQEKDFDVIKVKLRQYEEYLKDIDERLLDSSKVNEDLLKDKNRFYELNDKLRDIEFKANNEAQAPLKQLYSELSCCERDNSNLENQISKIVYQIEKKEAEIHNFEEVLQQLRENWTKINGEIFNVSSYSYMCPTCKRAFETQDIENKKQYLLENFNQNKSRRLAEINTEGRIKKDKVESLKREVGALKNDEDILKDKLSEVINRKSNINFRIENFTPNVDYSMNEEYENIKNEVAFIESKISGQTKENIEIKDLKERKAEYSKNIDEFKKQLSVREQNEKIKSRIMELMEEEKHLAEQIAELEGQEFLCEEYIKTKVELLESSINKRFKYVTFKLFNTLLNGSLEECCEALINGVPFGNANTASQINAGLDIINALSDHYYVTAPIFIDNRESVNKIIDCSSQIVNLIVSSDKNLKIEGYERGVA